MGPAAGGFGGGFPGGFGGAGGGGSYRVEDMGDLGDLFGGLFGRGRRGGGASGPQRGADLETELHLSFEDAVGGVTTSVNLTSDVRCHTCRGNRGRPGHPTGDLPALRWFGHPPGRPGPLLPEPDLSPVRRAGDRGHHAVPDLFGHRRGAPEPDGQGAHTGRRRGRPADPGQGEGSRRTGQCPQWRSLRRGPGGQARGVRAPGPEPHPHRARLLSRGDPGHDPHRPHPHRSGDPAGARRAPRRAAPSGSRAAVFRPGRKSATGDLLVTVEVAVPDNLTDDQRAAVEALAEVVDPPARDVLGV